jgi:hypothetical protein
MDNRSRKTMLSLILALTSLITACNKAADCYEKGDEKACQAVCETGKPDALPACYEIRARGALACVDGKGDCTSACANWSSAKVSEDVKKIYVAKLGSGTKVAALDAKCK